MPATHDMPYMTRAPNQLDWWVRISRCLISPSASSSSRRYWNCQYTPTTVMVWMGTVAAPTWLHDEELHALEAGKGQIVGGDDAQTVLVIDGFCIFT